MDTDLDSYIKNKGIRFPGRGRGGGGRGGARGRGSSRGGGRGFSRGGGGPPASRGGGVYKRQSSFSGRGGGPLSNSGGSSTLHISNLDFGVSNQDIKELFSEFGQIKKYAVHFDQSGRSLGTAEVHYTNFNSAAKAEKTYNNVPLDGRSMKIEVSGGASRLSLPRQQSRGGGGGRGFSRGGRGGAPRGGAGRGRGGAKRGPPPSLEDLDAELDAWKTKSE